MLDPIVNFFTRIFQWIGRGIGLVIGAILWPFLWAGRWYTQRGWILKAVVGLALLGMTGPTPVVLRLASDVHDAVRLRQRSPMVALGAAAFALWGAATLAGEVSGTDARLRV